MRERVQVQQFWSNYTDAQDGAGAAHNQPEVEDLPWSWEAKLNNWQMGRYFITRRACCEHE